MDNQELVSQLVSNARKALVEFEKYNQEQVDACVKACWWPSASTPRSWPERP